MNRNGVTEYWNIGVLGQEREKYKPNLLFITPLLQYSSCRGA